MDSLTANLTDPGPEVTSLLHALGYTSDLLRFDYPVWVGATISRLPIVGFARPRPQDMTTATIVAARSSDASIDGLFAAARTLASPVVLLSRNGQVELWSVPSDPGAEQRVNVANESDLGRIERLYQTALDPESLFAAKNSFRQLSLFPVDVTLLGNARTGLFSQLINRVNEAAVVATSSPQKKDSAETARIKEQRLINGSQIIIGALAALMIRDKFGLTSSGLDLFADAAQIFPNYFDSLAPILRSENTVFPLVLDILDNEINYEALDPRIVSHVYEEAIVDQSERLRSGIFYTPPELARNMLQHVPIEEIIPDERVIFDPACGSGTLLLAAHDRLQALTPIQWDRIATHDYVTKSLRGIDQDQFAVDIARLALLLHSLPEGNHWDVTRQDTLTTELGHDLRPTVIVSNPPWRDIRSKGGRRHQVADDFLRWTLEAIHPGGFFSIVLPSAWLSSSTSGPLRALVQERATIFEVWRLPDDTFASARTAPCVLFGQVRPRGRRQSPTARPWVFRRVMRPSSRERFYQTGVADEIYLGVEGKGMRSGTYLRGPLDDATGSLSELPSLGSIATVQNGPVPEPPVSARGNDGDFLWLRSAHMLPAFGVVNRDSLQRVRFPEDFHRAGRHDGSIFLRPKLIISGDRWTANPWRLKAGLDEIGVIPRDSLHMVIPRDPTDDTLHALLAILGSAFASAWIDSYVTKVAIDTSLIREMPIPPPGPMWPMLAAKGQQLVDAADSPALLAARARELDETVFHAYKLPERTRRSITAHFAGFPAPEGSMRYSGSSITQVPSAGHIQTFGAVLGVEDPGRLRIWVPGVTPDEGLPQPIPRRFLGWHCIEGATFDVDASGSLADAYYTFQRRSYQRFDDNSHDGVTEVSDYT